jgi:hypothetical protein
MPDRQLKEKPEEENVSRSSEFLDLPRATSLDELRALSLEIKRRCDPAAYHAALEEDARKRAAKRRKPEPEPARSGVKDWILGVIDALGGKPPRNGRRFR